MCETAMHRSVLVLGLCLGCGASQAPAAASSTLPSTQTQARAPATHDDLSLPQSMWLHFAYATAARDAVIAGHLDQARSPLLSLATLRPSEEVPVDWLPWVKDMQLVAKQGAESETLEDAAKSVAALANACGDCHRTTGGGHGDPQNAARVFDPQDKTGLDEKMARHKFSADALWVGLTGPEHQAWATGAAALMNIHVPSLVDEHGAPVVDDRRPSGEGSLQGTADARLPSQDELATGEAARAVNLDAALQELRELGARADQARSASQKQQIFAEMISRCGNCHAALGVRILPQDTARGPAKSAKRVVITADKILITEKIQFDFDAATIKPESHALLDEIVSVLQDNPQLRKISIEGHTDSDGEDDYNLKLSRDRAAAVAAYLTAHGVADDRLASVGHGERAPIASNDSEAGKEQNRRVEFLITEQDTVSRTHQIDPRTGQSHELRTGGEPR